MFEADALCDRIAVIAKGEIVAHGTPADLKAGVEEGAVVEVEVFGIPDGTVERVRELDGVRSVGVEERDQAQVLVVQTPADIELTSAILGRLNGASVGAYLAARADARGRLRGAGGPHRVRAGARLLAVGWLFHLKMLTRSAFDGLLGVVWPLFFATVAFFMFRPAAGEQTLLYASLGASVMGIWSVTSTSAGSAMQRERWHGTLEVLVAVARALRARAAARHDRDVDDRPLLHGRHAALGPAAVRNRADLDQPLLFALSIPVAIVSIGTFGFLLAVAFVRYRFAWALGNLLEYPVWLICGFLVPLTLLPELGAADLVAPGADVGHARDPRVRARRLAVARPPRLPGARRLPTSLSGVLVLDRASARAHGRAPRCR